MTEDRFDRCCWWYIALLVGCVLAVVAVMLVVSLLKADHKEPEPVPVETVNTETQVKADDPATWEAPPVVEEAPTSSFAPSDEVEEPAYQAVDRGRDEFQLYLHFVDAPGAYLEWRFIARYSYDNCLIPSGREVYYTGTTDHEASDAYKVDGLDAYSAYKCTTFVRLSGFPASPFCDEEFALYFVRTLREHGRSWEVGLAIAREESTWGTNPRARNLFGVCDPAIDMSDPVLGYCAFLDKHCGARDEMAWILNCGGYNPSAAYHQNILRLSTGIRGEAY